MSTRAAYGRPPVTTHAAIEQHAFDLFERQGFDATTMDDIAAAVGVGRRTLFRYYPSKNDILWGQFDDGLRAFAATLAALPDDLPVADAISEAIVSFNNFDEDAIPQHRQRMRLLLHTPALLAHSELRYAAWRSCIAEFTARRTGQLTSDPLPALAGRVALAVALSAYEQWLRDDGESLADVIRKTSADLRQLVQG